MTTQTITIDAYDYPLPDERIASHPCEERDRCRLLVRGTDGRLDDRIFAELPSLLPGRTMLVYNNTRVINARLRFTKASGAVIEVFCLEPVAPVDYACNFASTATCDWMCFVGNSKRWKEGALMMPLTVDGQPVTLCAERVARNDGSSVVRFSWDGGVTFARIIEAAGEIPIPPYLNRGTEASDASDYQTVFSHIDGSVAAPTAGLHFTDAVLGDIDSRGMARREVTLHVGAGTFQPVKSDTIGGHAMHSEFIAVDKALISELAATDRPVIAVGTTSVRTLESLYHAGCMMSAGIWEGEVPQWYPYSDSHPRLSRREAMQAIVDRLDGLGEEVFTGSTRLMIAPGYKYMMIDGMVTNFHQPRSTLLLLVSALIGDSWRDAYSHALATGYRFLSYGDACLFMKPDID